MGRFVNVTLFGGETISNPQGLGVSTVDFRVKVRGANHDTAQSLWYSLLRSGLKYPP